MNKNIDLIKILKDCPKGTKFYSILYGQVEFISVNPKNDSCQIILKELKRNSITFVDSKGKYFHECDGECTFFPSKDQRDWSKFSAPWYKKKKFDPKTLQPFDKILVKRYDNIWVATLLSHSETHTYGLGISYLEFTTINNGIYKSCIPYNEDTKHLLGTTEEVPEYYRYWEE